MIEDATGATLSSEESLRYARHLILDGVGPAGQRRLKQSRVLVVGAGGLGSPVTLYLAAAGVGTLGIADFDVVDVTNLQRQVIHSTADVGRLKLESARDRIGEINPHVVVEPHAVRLDSANALDVVREYDVVVDGTDNFPTRYLLNDACVLLGKPNVYGSILRWEGQASVFWAGRGPCYRCLFAEPPPPGMVPNCAEGGVLGVLPGIVGSIQAAEALKLLLGAGEPLLGRLLLFDALRMKFREMRLRRDPACPACGDHPTIHELIDYERFCGLAPDAPSSGRDMDPHGIPAITPTELKGRLDRGDRITIIDVREPFEWEIGNLETHGARLIPLGQLPERADEIDPADEVVLQCRSGARSAHALQYLRSQGYDRLWNLDGGILAWSDEVDPSIPRYWPMPTQSMPTPPGFVLLGLLLAALGVGCAVGVAGDTGVVGHAVFGLVALLTLVLVEAMWWVRPWVARAVDVWAAACVGLFLVPTLGGVLVGAVGFSELVLVVLSVTLLVGLPCAGVRWYVRDRAKRLGLSPAAAVPAPRP